MRRPDGERDHYYPDHAGQSATALGGSVVVALKRPGNVKEKIMGTPIIIKHLTKLFGNVLAVNNVSLTIEPGTFLTLLGPSGCGKTTLLRCVAGLEDPDEGEIYIGDKLVFSHRQGISLPAGKRDLGLVFQNYALWPHMTVYKNMTFAPRSKTTQSRNGSTGQNHWRKCKWKGIRSLSARDERGSSSGSPGMLAYRLRSS
jgi:multiple sugar transport system ATP-binding protein